MFGGSARPRLPRLRFARAAAAAVAVLSFTAARSQPPVVVNEIVSKNSSTLLDEDGESSDWIELHNVGDRPVGLAGYALADAATADTPWALPAGTLAPGGYLVVFASGKTRGGATPWHTDFRLSASGEALSLFGPDGIAVQTLRLPALDADESYSRVADGDSVRYVVSAVATPGRPNVGNALAFSHASGAYARAFALAVSAELSDPIHYTTDGSAPTPQSNLYVGPIDVTPLGEAPNVFAEIPTTAPERDVGYVAWRSPGVPVHKAHVLRFATYRAGRRTSETYTRTYFADGGPPGRRSLPVVSVVAPPEAFFDYDTGIYVKGAQFDPNDPTWTGNAFMRGAEWERRGYVEYFDTAGASGFAQDIGIRVHGGKTRGVAQKSLRLYARDRYGASAIEYPVFAQRDHSRYERLVLRSSMGAWEGPYVIKDALAHEVVETLDVEAQAYRPAMVYLNGEYWGVHTLTDRIDERYLSYVSGVPRDSVELWDWTQGDYRALVDFAEAEDLGRAEHYARVAREIDIGNFIDYTILQQFFANRDWPENNSAHWRRRGGRWRWILYDLDAGFGDPARDMIAELREVNPPTGEWDVERFSTALYRNLLANDDFVARYVGRYLELLETTLSYAATREALLRVRERYAPEMPRHVERWGTPRSVGEWRRLVDTDLGRFLSERPRVVRRQLRAAFGGVLVPEVVEEGASALALSVTPNPSAGVFRVTYEGDAPVYLDRVSVIDATGREVFAATGVSLARGEEYAVDVSAAGAGLYTVVATADGEGAACRMVVR